MDERNYQGCLYIYPLQNQLAMRVFTVKGKKMGSMITKRKMGMYYLYLLIQLLKAYK